MVSNRVPAFLVISLLLAVSMPADAQSQPQAANGCERTITANVVALDQPFLINRLGASMPEGMVFALERDVMQKNCTSGACNNLTPGNVQLRPYKRPRPIVLRANVGDCLAINFTNLLAPTPVITNPGPPPTSTQPATRNASVHVAGMEMVRTIKDDGSFVGVNDDSTVGTVPPGNKITYVLRATAEGTFMLNSEGATFGGANGFNDGAQVTAGLFGAVNVQPRGAEWYRSQVTHADFEHAIRGFSALGQPFINYKAKFPNNHPRAGQPVLAMLDQKNNLVYSDLTAVITGPNAGAFPKQPDPPLGDPNLQPVNIEPGRLEPYREFTIGYHELFDSVQAFPKVMSAGALANMILPATDGFAINYGTGGIGAEILANRFGLGPMGSCADCRFEEFFLSSWTVGDPSMLVDVPANTPCSNQTNNPSTIPNQFVGNQPTSAPCTVGVVGNAPPDVTPYRKATKVLYPDDPSNVYHSYLNDRVKFRVLHTGSGVSHVHHLHAHQWVHSPNSDGSTYLDSQLINPGSAYTLEITFKGGGNRNKTPGDAIFHCHFYPHFAAGMWSLWRVHDVYEVGSPFNDTRFAQQLGRYKTRALPDGEIAQGTPIPGLIPMPTLMMPPMPGTVTIQPVADPNGGSAPVGYQAVPDLTEAVNPGFPFFIPGVGGTRAPHPPLDFAVDNGVVQDGGLPRHVLLNAKITNEQHTALDFSKDYADVNAYELPEEGTEAEKVAMAFHAQCYHPSFTPEGVSSAPGRGFRTNGLPPAQGAPYADPALDPKNDERPDVFNCDPLYDKITYKAAVIQSDLVLNKKGWHYPQSRYLTLWHDVLKNIRSEVAQEPLFIRANSNTVVEYWHTNLVPDYFLLDDFEVRTPTDIIGQHIHLVKFDVTASDGAANGFNYEDGTFSYDEVQKLVSHINDCGGLATSADTITKCGNTANRKRLELKRPPLGICSDEEMKREPCKSWSGAQTTVQRWFADPIDYETPNGTRTLRTVFTHDHFGPSTHQQAGLYAAFVVEPEGSTWYQSETGERLNTRDDGGPTTWNAIIETPPAAEEDYSRANTYREFMLAVQDFHLAYRNDSPTVPNQPRAGIPPTTATGWSDPKTAIDPALASQQAGVPRPQIVSGGPFSGTTTFNYRNEPLPYRLTQPAGNAQGDPKATDLSYVFASNITRNDPAMNAQPTPGTSINPKLPVCSDTSPKPPNCSPFIFPMKPLTFGMQGGDPYTPLLRAYEGDRIQIRIVAGAHMLPHAFTMNGFKWLFEPSFEDSGYRSSQVMGISEHYEFLFTVPRASPSPDPKNHNWTDYLYMPDASNAKHGLIDGTWGIFRAYKSTADLMAKEEDGKRLAPLRPLSTNPVVKPLPPPTNRAGYSCPPEAPVKETRVLAQTRGWMFFNTRGAGMAGVFAEPNLAALAQNPPPSGSAFTTALGTGIVNSFPLLYTRADNPKTNEPLILRANAGDCIAVTVQNAFNPSSGTFLQTSQPTFDNTINLSPSKSVGLNPSLLSYDAMYSAGMNVGFNPDQVAAVGKERTYYWYAGQTEVSQEGKVTGRPMELGSVNLTPSDPLEQDLHGLVGGLIVEPAGAIACVDIYDPTAKIMQYASATVYDGGTCAAPGRLLYREFVLLTQDNLANVEWNGGQTLLSGVSYSATQGVSQVAINYRTEPMAYRFATPPPYIANTDVYRAFSDGFVLAEPQTPIFAAAKGTPTRFRLLHPGGSGNPQIVALHGHVWQELPYTNRSTSLGDNRLSQWLGMRDNYATNMAYEIVLPSAGGQRPVAGDYIWRNMPANILQQGMWGIFRVADGGSDAVRIASANWVAGPSIWVHGSSSVFLDSKADPRNGHRAPTVALYVGPKNDRGRLLSDKVPVGENGLWCLSNFSTLKNCAQMTPETVTWLQDAITRAPNQERFITAVSPNGGTAVAQLLPIVWPPPAPATPAPAATIQGESSRFMPQPRSHGERSVMPQTAPANPPPRPSEQQPPQQP